MNRMGQNRVEQKQNAIGGEERKRKRITGVVQADWQQWETLGAVLEKG